MRQSAHEQLTVRPADSRYDIDLPATVVLDQCEPVPARLINMSRHGCRLALAQTFAADQAFRLEVPGWPCLSARVVWSSDDKAGCLFDMPPPPKTFAMMCASVTAQDRDSL